MIKIILMKISFWWQWKEWLHCDVLFVGSDSGGFQHAIKELGTLALALLAGTFVLIITNILSCACLLYMRRRQIKVW